MYAGQLSPPGRFSGAKRTSGYASCTRMSAPLAAARNAALDRVSDPRLIGDVLDRYPALPPVIRRFVLRALLAVHSEVQDALVARIAGQAEVTARAAWIDLAVQLNATHALFESARHATDNDPGVRAAVARALGSLPSASSLDALTRLVIDPVETVRAAAARSVGRLGSVRGKIGRAHV